MSLLATPQSVGIWDDTLIDELAGLFHDALNSGTAWLLKGAGPFTRHQSTSDLTASRCTANGIGSAGISAAAPYVYNADGDMIVHFLIEQFTTNLSLTDPVETATGLQIQDGSTNAIANFTFATPLLLGYGNMLITFAYEINYSKGTLKLFATSTPLQATNPISADWADEGIIQTMNGIWQGMLNGANLKLLQGGAPYDHTQLTAYYNSFACDFPGYNDASLDVANNPLATDTGELIERPVDAQFNRDDSTPVVPQTVTGVLLTSGSDHVIAAWELTTPIEIDNIYELCSFACFANMTKGKMQLYPT